MSVTSVQVGIVDDHRLYRETLASVVAATEGFDVAFAVDSVAEAVRLTEVDPPHLVLVDLWLHGESGLDLVREIGGRWPDIRPVVVSGHRREAYAEQSLAAGARGYILKGDPGDFVSGIRHVAAGGTYLSDAVRGAAR